LEQKLHRKGLRIRISSLKIFQIRSLKDFSVESFDSRLNVIVGPNAVGKTSLLESLSMGTQLSSFRTSKVAEMITLGQTEVFISLILSEPTHSKISIGMGLQRRVISIDEKKIASRSKYPFLGSSVSFSPDDLLLIKGSPEARRKYLDDLCVSLDPEFEIVLARYRRVLQQRNNLLKKMKEGSARFEELPLWTETLIEAAVPIYLRRSQVIQQLNQEVSKIYQQLFNTTETVRVIYDHRFESNFTISEQDVENLMIDKLNLRAEAERLSGFSLVGPHKDDFVVTIDGTDSQTFASQGQTRGLVIALKVAQIEMSRELRKSAPILLLDDIISELDDQRVRALIRYLASYEGQMFVTTAEVNKVKALHSEFSNFKVIDLAPTPLLDRNYAHA